MPTICLFEAVRHTTRVAKRGAALEAVAQMQRATVVDLDAGLAHLAARLSLKYNLPLPDSIIYVAAQANRAKLYTQDADFEKLPGVKYVRKT